MAIRKEQGLLLGSLALLALLFVTAGTDKLPKRIRAGKSKEVNVPGNARKALVDHGNPAYPKGNDRDGFLRPSDTTPLKPLDIPLLAQPPLPQLPVPAPSIRPGRDRVHWYLTRVIVGSLGSGNGRRTGIAGGQKAASGITPGLPHEQDNQQQGVSSKQATVGQAIGGGNNAAAQQAEPSDLERWFESYDAIIGKDGRILWGRVLNDNRFTIGTASTAEGEALVLLPPFKVTQLDLRWINPGRGTVNSNKFSMYKAGQGSDNSLLDAIAKIRFANNVKNRIGMYEVRIPAGDTGLDERENLIHKLLREERNHREAFDAAERQAKAYIDAARKRARGYELLALVYSTTGQLAKELALYQDLMQGDFQEHSFVFRGLGRLDARLGLRESAEDYLRKSVRLNPGDGKSHQALAEFLYRQDRSDEALSSVAAAVRLIGPSTKQRDTFDIHALDVRCRIAIGQIEAARRALLKARNATGSRSDGDPDYQLLEAAVNFADGKYDDALAGFQLAGTSFPDSVDPDIASGLSALMSGDSEGALQHLDAAMDKNPLERHRVLAAKCFVKLIGGDGEEALSLIRDAQTMAPRDPYILYLLGHLLLGQRDFEAAAEVMQANLKRHPELIEVMADYAQLQLERSKESPLEAYELLREAERYADKAVEMEEGRGKLWRYQDLLGVIRYRLTDNKAARDAFKNSIAWAGKGKVGHAKCMSALLEYRQGDTNACLNDMKKIRPQLEEADPLNAYIDQVTALIRDHSGKRLFQDNFVSKKIRKHWKHDVRDTKWQGRDGFVQLNGTTKGQERRLRFTLVDALDFVEASVEIQIPRDFEGNHASFRLSTERIARRGKTAERNVEFRIAYQDQGLRIYASEGRERKKALLDLRARQLRSYKFDPDAWVRLGMVLVRPQERSTQRGVMIFTFDGQEVARCKVSQIQVTSRRPLFLDLVAQGDRGTKLKLRFRKFKLIHKGD